MTVEHVIVIFLLLMLIFECMMTRRWMKSAKEWKRMYMEMMYPERKDS